MNMHLQMHFALNVPQQNSKLTQVVPRPLCSRKGDLKHSLVLEKTRSQLATLAPPRGVSEMSERVSQRLFDAGG